MQHTVRPAKIDDCMAAASVLRKAGLNMPTEANAVKYYWERLWVNNPAITAKETRPDLGWVLEYDGKLVGFFGNLPLLYYFKKQPITVSSGSHWAILERHRHGCKLLYDEYFHQKNADILIATTAIKPVGRAYRKYSANKVPYCYNDEILFWISDTTGFIQSTLRKKNMHDALSYIGARMISPLLALNIIIGNRKPCARRNKTNRISVSDIGADFDDLWHRKINETNAMLACRSAHSLRWHFDPKIFENRATIITYRSDRLEGYAAVISEDTPNIGLKRLKIADILIADDDEGIFRSLLTECYQLAIDQKCHIVELTGLPPKLRNIAKSLKPYSRQMPAFPAYYKPLRPIFDSLNQQENWYFTAYDGDTSLK